jgi:hypothetical protein
MTLISCAGLRSRVGALLIAAVGALLIAARPSESLIMVPQTALKLNVQDLNFPESVTDPSVAPRHSGRRTWY